MQLHLPSAPLELRQHLAVVLPDEVLRRRRLASRRIPHLRHPDVPVSGRAGQRGAMRAPAHRQGQSAPTVAQQVASVPFQWFRPTDGADPSPWSVLPSGSRSHASPLPVHLPAPDDSIFNANTKPVDCYPPPRGPSITESIKSPCPRTSNHIRPTPSVHPPPPAHAAHLTLGNLPAPKQPANPMHRIPPLRPATSNTCSPFRQSRLFPSTPRAHQTISGHLIVTH